MEFLEYRPMPASMMQEVLKAQAGEGKAESGGGKKK
jgi:hypothetical protein